MLRWEMFDTMKGPLHAFHSIWSIERLCQHNDKMENCRLAENNDELLTLLLFTIFGLHSHIQNALCMENAGRWSNMFALTHSTHCICWHCLERLAYAGPGIACMLPFSSNSM